MTKRLTAAERNSIIADFNAGKETPGYTVTPSKTSKGRYTIKRKTVTEEKQEAPPKKEEKQEAPPQKEEQPEPVQEQNQEEEDVEDPDYNPYADDSNYYPAFKLNKNAMFREMQMQMNRMMYEQMKMLRTQQKVFLKKQNKMKARNKAIHSILTNVPQDDEPEATENVFEEEPTQQQEHPDYFSSNYKPANQELEMSEDEVEVQYEEPPKKEYENEYEQNIDEMAGDVYKMPSRSDRYNFANFPI